MPFIDEHLGPLARPVANSSTKVEPGYELCPALLGLGMTVRGVPDETERANLIAYLRTASDNPLPLP